MSETGRRLAFAFATAGGLGYAPVAPGTAGSLGAVVVFILARNVALAHPALFALIIAGTAATGVFAARAVMRAEGVEDPGKVVVDEVAGQWIALFLLPFSWPLVIAGFLLFRLFDIWKPFPVRQSERLGNGVGVMLDDILAGIYANLTLRLLLLLPWTARLLH